MEQSPWQIFHHLLQGEEIDFFPGIIPINPPLIDIMKVKNVYWPDAHRDARLMFELSSACHEILGFNAVNVPFDMAVEAEALGCETVWKSSISATPQIKEKQSEDESLLDFGGDILEKGRFPVVIEAISLLHDRFGKQVPVIPFIEGPFTLAGLVVGLSRMYKYIIKDPERTTFILDRMCDLLTLYAQRQLESGADTIIMLDPNVMGLTGPQFRDYILPVYRKFISEIKSPLILHVCGDVNKILNDIPETGFAAFSFDYPSVKPDAVKRSLGNSMKIIGSIPTISHLLSGKRDDVFSISIKMIEKGVDFLAPSCFTPPEAPLENVRAMKEAIHYWNTKNKRGVS